MPTLHWIGKEKVINHHLDVPYKVLEHRYGFDAAKGKTDEPTHSGNKIIHGDNLEALKSLLPEYEGKVKCIYIDPPYNTGNEGWVYNDNVNDPKIKKWLNEVVGKEGEDLSRHDKWLCMMYPRLKLLHRLLSEDGAIFISIDDNEQASLRFLLDEIFGKNNFVATFIWEKKYGPKADSKHISTSHDFILFFAKSIDKLVMNKLPRTDKQDGRYKNADNDPRGPWKADNVLRNEEREYAIFPVQLPSGREVMPPKGTSWRYTKEKFAQLIAENRIWFGKDGDARPAFKRFLTDVMQTLPPMTIWPHTEVGHSDKATKLVREFQLGQEFATPKPLELMERIVGIGANKDSIILDSFAGSGTTAHAVLNLNQRDNGTRKIILIEMESYAEEITAERIQKVIRGFGNDKKTTEGTGGAFDYYELGPPLFLENGNLNEAVGTEKIRAYVWYSETRSVFQEIDGAEPYLLGKHDDTAYYFVYEANAITCLDFDFLASMATKAGQYVIYADNCLLTKEFMAQNNIVFKKIPRDISRF